MDFWASLEHKLKYKKNIENAEEISKELQRCAEASSQLDLRMQALRDRIEAERE
jgi:putative GTP pyrophosphokinase